VDHDGIHAQIDQLPQQNGDPLLVSLCGAILDVNVLAFDVAEIVKPFPECVFLAPRLDGRREAKVSDPRKPLRLLRARRERPRDRRAAQNGDELPISLDHLVGGNEQLVRHGEAEHPGGLEIYHEFKLDRFLDREVGGFRALQDFVHINRRAAKLINVVRCI